jgi:hypothetical protein
MIKSLMHKIDWDKVVWGFTVRHWFWGIVASCVSYKLFHSYFMPWYLQITHLREWADCLFTFGAVSIYVSSGLYWFYLFKKIIFKFTPKLIMPVMAVLMIVVELMIMVYASLFLLYLRLSPFLVLLWLIIRCSYYIVNKNFPRPIAIMFARLILSMALLIVLIPFFIGIIGGTEIGIIEIKATGKRTDWLIPFMPSIVHITVFFVSFFVIPSTLLFMRRFQYVRVGVVQVRRMGWWLRVVKSATSDTLFSSRYHSPINIGDKCMLAYDPKNESNNIIWKVLKPKGEVEL